ncbi:MAG: class I SAM-dependent methyltransferase [Balneolaceae bacterium]|nr:class I SAM-dependent methyltransferase [Balneolaceae bacterium]MBO6545737.1 class I SAM-dependent methyltransferase [Balneolaceae bacterium]MBO6647133.1 class I SAM-dependent methyltransferase [Balneolaceae bacterium]
MNLELRSPVDERATIQVPKDVAELSKPFNGTVCSQEGDEYKVRNNIIDILGKEPAFSSLAQSTNHFKLTASIYEDIWRKRSLSLLSGEDFPIEKEHELLIEWTAPKAGGLYLDLGCSTALYGRALKAAQKEADIVALDFSSQMLEEARLKAEADETDLFLVRADGKEIPFFSKTFDGIVMGGTLNELSEELKVLYEARRVIKQDGVFFVMHLIKSDAWYGRLLQESISLGGIQFWTKDESNKLFNQAGFKVAEQLVRGIVCFTKLVPD